MGYISYCAKYYKNGSVDRQRECDAYFMEGLNAGTYEVLKSSLRGSIYYAAVKSIKSGIVFAAVFKTSVDMKDYFNFSYKPMDESACPYYYDCPESILKLLSPTNNAFAMEWRAKCYANIAKKKDKNSLQNLPLGTKIKITLPFNTKFFKEGEQTEFIKTNRWRKRAYWYSERYNIRFADGLMQQLKDCYELI